MLVLSRINNEKRFALTANTATLRMFPQAVYNTSLIVAFVATIVTAGGIVFMGPILSPLLAPWPPILSTLVVILLIASVAILLTHLLPSWRKVVEELLPVGVLPIAIIAAAALTRLTMVVFFGVVIFTIFGALGITSILAVVLLALYAVSELILTLQNIFEWRNNDADQQLEDAARQPQNS